MQKNFFIWFAIGTFIFLLFQGSQSFISQNNTVSYSQFIQKVDQNLVESVLLGTFNVNIKLKDGTYITTKRPPTTDITLIDQLLAKGVDITGSPQEPPGLLKQLFFALLPIIVLAFLFFWLMKGQSGMSGRGGGPFGVGKSRAKRIQSEDIKTTFKDVAGADENKEELKVVVDFLKNPTKYTRLGGRIPKGVIMSGMPGTGKTLLAKAIAGEACVPFFSISGSDFVEMFVGVGASRVRDLFEQARKSAPCIIFIDEIDAVGRERGAGLGGGHDEREQTLNQLLVEMDGFDPSLGIIVIAATNRPDVLDSALLRAGRFDRKIYMNLPDIKGREEIFVVHTRAIPLDEDVKLLDLAKGTPGFSGADIANLVNEGAILAAQNNKRRVNMKHLTESLDKLLMGPERRHAMQESERLNTAHHESGHAILGILLPEADPVYKISIIPRGRALGVTTFLPEKDHYSISYQSLLSRICIFFGGRVAEELILGKHGITTGAENDIQQATKLARHMIMRWGFSNDLGPIDYDANHSQSVFLGRSMNNPGEGHSDATIKQIDDEVRQIIQTAYEQAKTLLTENLDKLKLMAEALMLYETIGQDEIKAIMNNKMPEPPEWFIDRKAEKQSESESEKPHDDNNNSNTKEDQA